MRNRWQHRMGGRGGLPHAARSCIILRRNEVPAPSGQEAVPGEAQPRPPLLDSGAPGRRLIFVRRPHSEGVPVPAQGPRAVLAAAGRDVEGGTVRQGGLAQERAQVPAAEGRGVGGAAPQGVPAQETRQVLAAAGRGVVGGAAPQGVPAHETRQVPAAAGRGVVGGVGHRRLMQAAPRLALPFREEADDPEEPRVPPHRRDRHVDRRTSLAWHFFSDLHDDSHHARCNLCGGLCYWWWYVEPNGAPLTKTSPKL